MFVDPAVLRAGAFELRWSGALLAVGLALGYLGVRAAAARAGVSPRTLHDAALWSLPEALLAARVAYILAHPDIYLAAPARVVQIWDGGFSFGAGLLVGAWATARYARRHRLAGGPLLNAAVPGLLIAQALAALGRAADVLATPRAPWPPWDQAPCATTGPVPAATPIWLGGDSLVAATLGISVWALALLLAYAALGRRRPASGLVFRSYLLLQALGQIAVRLATGGAAPDMLGIVAWMAVAVAAVLSGLYHLRSAGWFALGLPRRY